MQPRYGSGSLRFAVHDRGVKLVLPVVREDCSFTGVEKRRILENTDGRLHRVQAGLAGLKSLITRQHRFFQLVGVFLFTLRGERAFFDDSGTAVDDEAETRVFAGPEAE